MPTGFRRELRHKWVVPLWRVNSSVIAFSFVPIDDFHAIPGCGYARLDREVRTDAANSQNGFKSRPITPARSTRIPCPAAAAAMWSHGVDVGSNHVWLYLVAARIFHCQRVIDRVDQPKQPRGQFRLPQFRERIDSPDRSVRILTPFSLMPGG